MVEIIMNDTVPPARWWWVVWDGEEWGREDNPERWGGSWGRISCWRRGRGGSWSSSAMSGLDLSLSRLRCRLLGWRAPLKVAQADPSDQLLRDSEERRNRVRFMKQQIEQRTKMSGRLLKESALCCNALYAHAAWARATHLTSRTRWITKKERLILGKLQLTAGLDFRVS